MKTKEETYHHLGDIFEESPAGDAFMLCQVGCGVLALIGLDSGNRYTDGKMCGFELNKIPFSWIKRELGLGYLKRTNMKIVLKEKP